MNWKKHAYLFVNDKFKIKTDFVGFYPCVNKICGYEPKFVSGKCDFYVTHNTERHLATVPVENCTLIARPISDMTDEELKNVSWRIKAKHVKDKNRTILTNDFLYLLSIGVYPFYDDTDVIYK